MAESQSRAHSGRIGLDRRIEIVAELRKILDEVNDLANIGAISL
jgi:hypothetical protein